VPVSFATPNILRQGVVAGFVLAAPDYSGTPEQAAGAAIYWNFSNANIVVGGVTIDIGTGYQHWVNIGGAVFSYVQEANSLCYNDTDTATIIVAYLANAINAAGFPLCTATASSQILTLTPRQNTGAAIPVTASTSAYPNNMEQILFELSGNELVPTISLGVLFAQGQMYRPSVAPILPAAPASQQSWLFWNSGTGWYWKNSATPNTSDDACVGWVRTSATAVIAFSSSAIGTGEEAAIVSAGPAAIEMGGAGDTGVPPAPTFNAAETSTQLLLGDLAFATMNNTAGIDFAMFNLYYVNETVGTPCKLSAAMGIPDTSLGVTGGPLAASVPGSVTFTFYATPQGALQIGPGYQHSIGIGAQTYSYVQQTEDTPSTIAQALANTVNAYADPNATAVANPVLLGTVVLHAAQNTAAHVTCSASDGNAPGTLIETLASYVAIDQEIIQAQATNGSVIVRGQKGSVAATHSSGAKIWPVITTMIVFALPPLAYGTPAWPTVVGQIPFAACALVAADCWVANEIGPSPVTTQCYSGQGPYAVDANGIPLAPDVAGFTAAVTVGIEIGGLPYYQFNGTVQLALATGTTTEIDVAMVDANGTSRTVYKYFGPFTANETLNWASIPYPQPTSGAPLVFTPVVIPLNTDLTPTVSSQMPAALTVGNGVPGASTAPNVTGSCTLVDEGNGNFGFTGSIIMPVANPNYALLQAGSIAIQAGPSGGTMTTFLTESAWGSATTLNFTAGTPSANAFPWPATLTNWVVQFVCKTAAGVAAPNPLTFTFPVQPGPAPNPTSATAAIAYSRDGNQSVVLFNGALGMPASVANLSKVAIQLVLLIGTAVTTTPYATFSATDIGYAGAGGTLTYGPAVGNVGAGIMQPQYGTDWTVGVQYVVYNAAGTPSAAVTIASFPVYVSKVTALAVAEGTRSADANGSTYTQFTLTPTVYEPGVYTSGNAPVETVWLSQDAGATFVWKAVVTPATSTSTIAMGNTASTAAVNTGVGIFVPAVSSPPQWQFAIAAGWYNSPANGATITAAALAAQTGGMAVYSPLFTVAPVGAPAATDLTGLSLLTYPSPNGSPICTYTDSAGTGVLWTFKGITGTLAGLATDPNLKFVEFTLQWTTLASGSSSTDFDEVEYCMVQASALAAAGGTFTIPGPPVGSNDAWDYPANGATNLFLRIRAYATSGLNGSPFVRSGSPGTFAGNAGSTVQLGWPGGASFGLITFTAPPSAFIAATTNPGGTPSAGLTNDGTGTKLTSTPALPNGGFEYLNTPGAPASGALGWTVTSGCSIESTTKFSGSYALQMAGGDQEANSVMVPCKPGDQIVAQAYASMSSGATGADAYVYIFFFTAAGVYVAPDAYGVASLSAGAWSVASTGVGVAPATAAQFYVALVGYTTTGYVYFDQASFSLNSPAVSGSTLTPASVTGGSGGALVSATVTGTNVAATTIAGGNIQNATVTGTNVAATTIAGGNIQNATVTGTNVASSTIAGGNIGSSTVTGSNVASTTIAGGNVAGATITGTNVASLTIAAGNVVSSTLTNAQIASSTIGGGNIQGSTITGSNLANQTITATQIGNAVITGTQIANAAIVAGNIHNATITGTQIATSTISGTQLQSATIYAAQIASSTITATQIASATIAGGNIANLTITASQIANLTITSAQLGTLSAVTITGGTISGVSLTSVTISTGSLYIPINGVIAFAGGGLSSMTWGGSSIINFSGQWVGGVPTSTAPSTSSGGPGTTCYGSPGAYLGAPVGWLNIGGVPVPHY
jgi:uncharacterized protein YjbI with pentapeptide repeats